jgi:hypothetical protein
MSERWKFQILNGGLWAVFMIVIMTVFDAIIDNDWMNGRKIAVRTVTFLIGGIFFVGYWNWKSRVKKQ